MGCSLRSPSSGCGLRVLFLIGKGGCEGSFFWHIQLQKCTFPMVKRQLYLEIVKTPCVLVVLSRSMSCFLKIVNTTRCFYGFIDAERERERERERETSLSVSLLVYLSLSLCHSLSVSPSLSLSLSLSDSSTPKPKQMKGNQLFGVPGDPKTLLNNENQ